MAGYDYENAESTAFVVAHSTVNVLYIALQYENAEYTAFGTPPSEGSENNPPQK